jgi:hypothetical protein
MTAIAEAYLSLVPPPRPTLFRCGSCGSRETMAGDRCAYCRNPTTGASRRYAGRHQWRMDTMTEVKTATAINEDAGGKA